MQLRNRFTEVYVAEMDDREDLQRLVLSYLQPVTAKPPAAAVVDFYLAARSDAVSWCCDHHALYEDYCLLTHMSCKGTQNQVCYTSCSSRCTNAWSISFFVDQW